MLHKVENSVLWLAKNNDFFKKNILIEFENQGIDINRIIFAEYAADHAEHIARLSLADLFLDTFPYCAQSTALDSVNAGLPILTRSGRSFSSKVSSSILSALDSPELITQSDEAYISMAVQLASEPELLLQIRNKIKMNFSKTSLGQVSLSTRNLENAYKHMYQCYLNDLSPDHFSVEIS
jgi:predicted O-linked N-acetylglucosamine transferase (SPINDLY family)